MSAKDSFDKNFIQDNIVESNREVKSRVAAQEVAGTNSLQQGDPIIGSIIIATNNPENADVTSPDFDGAFVAAENQVMADGTQDAWLAKINAGEVEFSVGVDGIYNERLTLALEQLAEDSQSGESRNVYFGTLSLDGRTKPSAAWIYGDFTQKLTYPYFEDGAFADWTAVSGSYWTVLTDDKGKTYATFTQSDTGEKRVSVAKVNQFILDYDGYAVSGTAYVKVIFYSGLAGTGDITNVQTYNLGSTRKREQRFFDFPDASQSARLLIGATSGIPIFYKIAVYSIRTGGGTDGEPSFIGFEPQYGRPVAKIGNGGARPGLLLVGDMTLPRVDDLKDKLVATPGAAGNVDVGDHGLITTFVDAYGETDADLTQATSVTVSASAKTVALSAIPIGRPGTTARKVYGTIAGATQTDPTNYYLITTISGNVTTTGTYNISDATLVGNASLPTVNTTGSRPTFPKRWTCFGDDIITSVTMAENLVGGTHPYGTYWGPTAANANDGDSYFFDVFIDSGTYTITVIGVTRSDCAKVDYYLDNVLIVSGQDWYTAAATVDVTKVTGAITVSTPGYHTLEIKVNGKHASSTDYRMFFTKLTFKPTAY